MGCWAYRVWALVTGCLGVALIGVVCRAVYLRDEVAQSLMFRLGMPLVLLSTLAGGLLLCVAGLLFKTARTLRSGRRPWGEGDPSIAPEPRRERHRALIL